MVKSSFKIFFTFVILFLSFEAKGQISQFHSGISIGTGSFSGETIPQSGLSASISFGFKHEITGDVAFRFSYTYIRKINYFFPENRIDKYYPLIQSLTVTANIEQAISERIFLQEGAGLSALNDRTFSGLNEWDFGIIFGLTIGVDFKDINSAGWRIGLGGEVAETFTNTTASYYLLNVNVYYYFQ